MDRVTAVEPAKTLFGAKAQIRRIIEAEGIPYTYVCSNSFAGYFIRTISQPGGTAPPRDKITISGDGNPKSKQPLKVIQLNFPLHFLCLMLECTGYYNQ